MAKLYWEVKGFEGLDSIYEAEFPIRRYTEKTIKELLRMLYAREALTHREIAEAVGRKDSLLHVHRQADGLVFMCGSNPHFVARIMQRD